MTPKLELSTRALVADHDATSGSGVAPYISLSTTFRHPVPGTAVEQEQRHVYSRYTTPTLSRAEKSLSSVIGYPTLLYPSGLSASHAMLIHYAPDVVAVTNGYHGFLKGTLLVYCRLRNVRVIALDDDYTLRKGEKKLLAWVETPLNPTGECRDIAHFVARAHAVGGKICVDSTFGPPPMQDPFAWGADYVMHSATKYFLGHSDALGGTLSVRNAEEWPLLWSDRTYIGTTPGSLETWLTLRSLRTLDMRVRKQSATATALAFWLAGLTRAFPGSDVDGPADFILSVTHASLQENSRFVGKGKQMDLGPATFSFKTTNVFFATHLPHCLEIFTPATSLGGVESLIEQRLVSDADEDPCLIRMSVGVENLEDLKQDLRNGMRRVLAMRRESKL